MLNGVWTDFISDFMSYTETDLSSDIHRRWAAISLVASALERRVWVRSGSKINYPNLYTVFVAPSGFGKYIIEEVRNLLSETKQLNSDLPAFKISPDSMTRASMVDELAAAKQTFLPPEGSMISYNSLSIVSEEFEVLLPAYDPSFISVLNGIYNNKVSHHETRRHGPAQDVLIGYPQLNILAGATPSYFTAHFPEEAWNTGLIRRIIMVYSATPITKDIFEEDPNRTLLRKKILYRLTQMSRLYGENTWEEAAMQSIRNWHLEGRPPEPTHSRLTSYRTSRTVFVLKLSLISAVARNGVPHIETADVRRAMEWLFEAEAKMPDIFRAMVGKNDAQIIEEMWHFMQSRWGKERIGIPGSILKNFLHFRIPSEKIIPILSMAEQMDVIARQDATQDLWVPRPKTMHGVE